MIEYSLSRKTEDFLRFCSIFGSWRGEGVVSFCVCFFEVNALYWLSSSEQTEKRVSQRYGTFKGFVSGNPRDYKEVDDAAEKLGQSSWRAGDHVPRQTELSRHGQSAFIPLRSISVD